MDLIPKSRSAGAVAAGAVAAVTALPAAAVAAPEPITFDLPDPTGPYGAEARHFSFTDFHVIMPRVADGLGLSEEQVQGAIGTADAPGRLDASQRAYVRAFFDHHLRGEPRPVLDADSPEHPDARLVG